MRYVVTDVAVIVMHWMGGEFRCDEIDFYDNIGSYGLYLLTWHWCWDFTFALSYTRKSSCVNARGIPPARGRKMLTPPRHWLDLTPPGWPWPPPPAGPDPPGWIDLWPDPPPSWIDLWPETPPNWIDLWPWPPRLDLTPPTPTPSTGLIDLWPWPLGLDLTPPGWIDLWPWPPCLDWPLTLTPPPPPSLIDLWPWPPWLDWPLTWPPGWIDLWPSPPRWTWPPPPPGVDKVKTLPSPSFGCGR